MRRAHDPLRHGRARRGVIKVALRGLAGRKLRAVLTGIAIVLGVAMISGTYILTDTVQRAFNNAPRRLVRRHRRRRDREGASTSRSTARRLRRRPSTRRCSTSCAASTGVALATGSVLDERNTKILTAEGEAVNSEGFPTLGFGVDTDSGTRAVQSAEPLRGPLARRTTTRSSSTPGQPTSRASRSATAVEISTLQPKRPFELVGVAKYGEVDSLGAISFVVFTIPAAQELLGREGQYDAISVAASEGVSEDDARRRDRARAAGERRGRERDGGGARAGGRGERVHVDLPILPARVRRASRSSSARSSSSTRSRSPLRSERASSRRCGRSARRGARSSAR